MALLALLFALFLLIGAIAARKVKNGTVADLMVAGRALPQWMALLTMTATWVDGGYLLGTAEGAFKTNIASGVQGGLCFGVSLIIGGIFFSGRMRKLGFNTLIDPFESRFGKHWAAVLFIPAMLAEVFWSAELLVAIGSSLDVILGVRLTMAILLAAAVVTAYTMMGGLWSVAYTDAFQLALVALGLLVALPFILQATGGLSATLASYAAARPHGSAILPPIAAGASAWTWPAIVNWWDVAAMLTLGGIPWNCYFQRVLSCRSVRDARKMSIGSGLLTMAFVVPPLLVGIAAFRYPWPPDLLARVTANPSETLPLMFKQTAPAWVALLGLMGIVGAVTSSFSSSILSAATMFSWNCCKRLVWPSLSARAMKRLIRIAVGLLGAGALVMALKVQSVQALWFFTSDLVFVLLFPQLVYALFDPAANRIGSMTAFFVSLVLRVGGGEPLLGIKPLIPYPEIFTVHPAEWYDPATGAMLFPFKTLAAVAGLILLPLVSRMTARANHARTLINVSEAEIPRVKPSAIQRAQAWAVHLFTSLGLVAAAGIAVLIVRGGDDAFRGAFGLMCVATVIDAVDGTFAKLARVGEVLPHFDGRRLDDIIDFHTYTSLPLLLIWRADILPPAAAPVLLLPLLASAYGFSRVAAKTDDGHFLGFPSYWNIVAFYLYFLAPPPSLAIAVIVILAFLTFVPVRYLYSTNPGRLNRIANLLAIPWTAMLAGVLIMTDHSQRYALTLVSLYYPAFYLGASWWCSLRDRSVTR